MNFRAWIAIAAVVVFITGLLNYAEKKTEKTVSSNSDAVFLDSFPPDVTLTPVGFDGLTGFAADDFVDAFPALKSSCGVLSAKNPSLWKDFCAKMVGIGADGKKLRAFIMKNMRPYAVNKGKKGLFTGYYEPEIDGSLIKKTGYDVPVYALPDDIVKIDLGKFNPKYRGEVLFGKKDGAEIKPYSTRREIETGAVKIPAKAIAWVKEPADLFVLQIQGSGVLRLPDGKRIGIGYAGNNGRAFTGIGAVMAKRGLLKKGVSTMAEIKQWLIDNPTKAQSLMHENRRYIFFKLLKTPGAVGAAGVRLTAGRSLAVDPAFMPLGSFLWLETTAPDGSALNRLMTAQDTGSAIKGAIRGDFFWGRGDQALKQAGRMKSEGTYFVLLPANDTDGRQ